MNELLEAALRYARLGWPVLACRAGAKEPRFPGGVNAASTDETKIRYWWSIEPNANIGVRCGPGSFTVIDADGPEGSEAYAALREAHNLPDTFMQESPKGTHYLFSYAPEIGCTQSKLAPKIDTRGQDKGYIVVAPSVLSSGKGYKFPAPLNGEPPRFATLPESVLAIFRPHLAGEGDGTTTIPPRSPPAASPATQDAQFIEQRAALWLAKCDPAVQGQGGHGKLLWAARGLVQGFTLDFQTASRLLETEFNPKCVPPWDLGQPAQQREFSRKIREASKPFGKPRGWLLEEEGIPAQTAIAEGRAAIASLARSHEDKEDEPATKAADDPGPIDDALLGAPGFIQELMDWTLVTAPYPNLLAAFGAAVAMQAYLAGRKVRDVSGLRTNLYVLMLADSGSGKDHPRKTNYTVAHDAGLSDGIIRDVASSQGLEDFLLAQPNALWQADEMDGLIRAMSGGTEMRYEEIRCFLLSMFSESQNTHQVRKKAVSSWARENGCEKGGDIVNPCLTIHGSAIPEHFYSAVNEMLMTTGVIPRMLILEGAHIRRIGQEPALIDHPPQRLVDTAVWWKEFNPGGGNMNTQAGSDPCPATVQQTEGAAKLLESTRRDFDRSWNESSSAASKAVWARAAEITRKLALIFACSKNYEAPVVDVDDATRAEAIIRHQIKRMLFMVDTSVGGTWFDIHSRRILTQLRDSGKPMIHSELLKKSKMAAKPFKDLVATLEERGEVIRTMRPRKSNRGASAILYSLVE